MSDTIRKVFIDTRYRVSGTNSDFTINLPFNCNYSENTKMFVDDIILPNVVKTVNENNNKLYFRIFYNTLNRDRILTIPTNIYNAESFKSALQSALTDLVSDLEMTLTVDYNFVTNLLSITMVDDRVSPTDTMQITIYPDDDLIDGNTPFTITTLQTANEIIGMSKNSDYYILEGQPFYGVLDLHTIRAFYLTSSTLTSYDTVTNFKMDTIVKKIPVKAGFNEIIYDNMGNMFDYVNVGRRTLSQIDFQLRDTKGNIVNLWNTHWSFSIIFVNLE
jgi:hypothetical protein